MVLSKPHISAAWLALGRAALPTVAKMISVGDQPKLDFSPRPSLPLDLSAAIIVPVIKDFFFFTLSADGRTGGSLASFLVGPCYSPVLALVWGVGEGGCLPGHVAPASDLRQLWVGGCSI